MELEINPRTIDQILILDCAGRMVSGEDLHSAKEAVKQLVSTTNAVVVNLEAVSYLDSEGLSVLVGIHSSVKNRGGKAPMCAFIPKLEAIHSVAIPSFTRNYKGGCARAREATDVFCR